MKKILALGILVFLTGPAIAGNVQFLKDSAISKMNDEDLGLLRSSARNALDYAADGESRRWENVQTGSTGVLTPLATFDREGTLCRKLEIFNDVRGVTGRTVFDFCRQPDGTWKVPAPGPGGAVGQN